jgi:hypothetical protein
MAIPYVDGLLLPSLRPFTARLPRSAVDADADGTMAVAGRRLYVVDNKGELLAARLP